MLKRETTTEAQAIWETVERAADRGEVKRMKMLRIAGIYINSDYIREVKFLDYDNVVAWIGDEREPRHCFRDEVQPLRAYIDEVMA